MTKQNKTKQKQNRTKNLIKTLFLNVKFTEYVSEKKTRPGLFSSNMFLHCFRRKKQEKKQQLNTLLTTVEMKMILISSSVLF